MREKRAVEILLVEDDPDDIELTLHALREHKLANRIHVVEDGEQSARFSLLPGKVRRPQAGRSAQAGVVGFEVAESGWFGSPASDEERILHQGNPGGDIDLFEAYELGANSYIQKPVEFTSFRERVKELGYYWLLVNEPPPVTNRAETSEVEAWSGSKVR